MAARRPLTPNYVPQTSVTDPYFGDYSALAAQLYSNPSQVHSIGQGLANVAGDLGEAYFQKKALDKAKASEAKDYSDIAMAQQIASNPGLSRDMDAGGAPVSVQGGQASPVDMNPQQQPGMADPQNPGMRYAQVSVPQGDINAQRVSAPDQAQMAMQYLGQQNPRLAAQYGPALQQMAQSARPPTFTGTLGNNQSAFINGTQVASGPTASESTLGKAADDLRRGLITQDQFNAISRKETDISGGKVSYRPMSASELKAWGMPPGTVASISSEGKPDIVNKAGPGSFLADMGVTPDDTPDVVKEKLGMTTNGKNILTQAQAIVDGRELITKATSRNGESLGNQIRAATYAIDPSYNPMVGQARFQLNQELNDLGNTGLGGKIASANKIVNHASELLSSAVDLKNNGILGNFGNQAENYIVGSKTGSPMKTNLREFTDIKSKLGTESAKFMGGGVASDAAQAEVDRSYNPNDDITGTIGAVGGTVKMMEGQLQPVVDRYNQTYGTHLDITDPKFMSPATAAKLTTLKSILDASKAGPINPLSIKNALSGQPQPGTPGSGQPPQASGPAVGEIHDGYQFKGGDPNDKNNWTKQ